MKWKENEFSTRRSTAANGSSLPTSHSQSSIASSSWLSVHPAQLLPVIGAMFSGHFWHYLPQFVNLLIPTSFCEKWQFLLAPKLPKLDSEHPFDGWEGMGMDGTVWTGGYGMYRKLAGQYPSFLETACEY